MTEQEKLNLEISNYNQEMQQTQVTDHRTTSRERN